MKRLLLCLLIIIGASGIITGLTAFDNYREQVKKISISLTQPEVELILRSLGKLPLEESANLYFSIQSQAQAQLSPTPIVADSTNSKKGKR